MEPDGLMDAGESEYKGIRVINYILAPGNPVRRVTLNRIFAK